MYEDEIRRANKDSSLSENSKYCNSVRLFALIDLARKRMEVKAVHAKAVPSGQIWDALVNSGSDGLKVAEGLLPMLKEEFRTGGILGRELAHLQWRVFKLSVFFPPLGDVSMLERVVRFPHFGLVTGLLDHGRADLESPSDQGSKLGREAKRSEGC